MKKLVLLFLFFTYIVSVLKPMLPFVADAVAHAFFYQKHIATVHSVNGKRHVHHEFVRTIKNDNTRNNTANNKKIEVTDDHLFLSNKCKTHLYICVNPTIKSVNLHLISPPLFSQFPPPKFFLS